MTRAMGDRSGWPGVAVKCRVDRDVGHDPYQPYPVPGWPRSDHPSVSKTTNVIRLRAPTSCRAHNCDFCARSLLSLHVVQHVITFSRPLMVFPPHTRRPQNQGTCKIDLSGRANLATPDSGGRNGRGHRDAVAGLDMENPQKTS